MDSSELLTDRNRAIASWQSILQVTNSLEGMSIANHPLRQTALITEHRGLHLPTLTQSLERLETRAGTSDLPQELVATYIESRKALASHIEQSYRNALQKMTPMESLTGQSAKSHEIVLAHAIEKWFQKAEQQLMMSVLEAMESNRCVVMSSRIVKPIAENSDILLEAFRLNNSPNDKERETLAKACGMSYKQVTTWFQNRRQRTKQRGAKKYNTEAAMDVNSLSERPPIPRLPESSRRKTALRRPRPKSTAQPRDNHNHLAASDTIDEPNDVIKSETRRRSLLFTQQARESALPPETPISILSGEKVHTGYIQQHPCVPILSLAKHSPDASDVSRNLTDSAPLPPFTVLPRSLPQVSTSGEASSSRSIRALPKAKARFSTNTAGESPTQQSALPYGAAIPSNHQLFTSQPLPLNERTTNYDRDNFRVPSLTRSVSSASNSTAGSDASSDQQEASSFFHGFQYGGQPLPRHPHTVTVPLSRERGTAQWTGSSDTGFATSMHSKWEAPAGHEFDRTPTQQRFNEQATYSSPTVQYQTSQFGSSTYFIPQRDGYQLMTSQDGSQFWVATSDLVPTATNPPETIHRHSTEQELRVVSNSLPIVSQEIDENKGFLTSVTSQSSDSTPSPYLEGGGELNAYIVDEALERLSRETSLMKADGYSFSFDEVSDLSGEENLMDEFTLKDMEALLSLSATPEPAPGRNVSPGSDISVALPGLSSSESSPNATQVITPQTASLDKGKYKEESPDHKPEQVATVKIESVNEDAWVTPESSTLDSFFTGAEWEWGLLPFDMPGVDEVFTLCTESV